MQKRFDVVQDPRGNAVEGATIEILIYPGGGIPTIYSDDGVAAITGAVLTTDEDGYFEYYAPNGRYTWRITTNAGVKTLNDVIHDDTISRFPQFAAATGTGNAMVVAGFAAGYTLSDGDELRVRAPGANTISNPTIQLPGVGVLTIVRAGGRKLGLYEIKGSGHELLLRYRAAPARIELVNAGRFDAINVKTDFGAVGDGVTDDTAALQAAITATAASWNGPVIKPALYLPAGIYKITASLVFPTYAPHMYGDGRYVSLIKFDDVAGACLTTVAQVYFNPNFHDFGITGNAASGMGIDLSTVTGQVFNGNIARVDIACGGDGIYAPNLFSFAFDDININSVNGHCFRVSCGPSVSFRNCYAAATGANKAGYRLTGTIRLYSCNGVNSSNYWGVFGSNITGAGNTALWQNDFAVTSYPDIEMHGCNVESFGLVGLWCVQSPQQFVVRGGVMQHNSAVNYHSFTRVSQNPLNAGAFAPILDGVRMVRLGGGVATGADIYSDAGATALDLGGSCSGGFATTQFLAGPALTYPIPTAQTQVGDVFQDQAVFFSAISPRRISAQMLRFKELAVASAGAANVNLDITGYTFVRTVNTGAYSLERMTHTTTLGAGLDAARNGFLMLEIDDDLTTLLHGREITGGLWLKDRADVKARKGDIFLFVESSFLVNGTAQRMWAEIGRRARTSTPTNVVRWMDDFPGDVLADEWNARVGSDGACVAPAIRAGQIGGVMRMTTGAGAGATMIVNGVRLDAGLNWKANTTTYGALVFETTVVLDAITNVAVFVGLSTTFGTGALGAGDMPFTLAAGDVLTSNDVDAVGVLFDTGADTDNWFAVGVSNNVDAAKQNLAIAPVAATPEKWRIELYPDGSAKFFRDDKLIGVSMAGACRSSVNLTPCIAAFARAAASRNIDSDFVLTEMPR